MGDPLKLNPSLQAGLLGAGIGGLGGALFGGEDKVRNALIYAALGGGLGGAGHYAATNWEDLFPSGEKKEEPEGKLPAPPGAADLISSALPESAGGKVQLGGALASVPVGAAAGGAIRSRLRGPAGKRIAQWGALQQAGAEAKAPYWAGKVMQKRPLRTAGGISGAALAALAYFLSKKD